MENKKSKLTNEEMVKMAKQMKRLAEKDLDEHFNNMVQRAKQLVQDLERTKVGYFTDLAEVKAKYFQYALDEVNNCNYRMSNAAGKLAKFEKANALLKAFEGEDISFW